MKSKKIVALMMSMAMVCSLVGCTNGDKSADDKENEQQSDAVAEEGLSYADIKLGEEDTELTANISVFNHRTDLESADYLGKKWSEYIADFNQVYPNITVDMTTDSNYAEDALTHLQSGDYETIMMIPAVDKVDLSEYFISYGDLETMKKQINYATTWEYGGQVYGVPSTANTMGIVYNKKVFEQAGVTELPKTPDEFLEALKAIREKTDAIPLYTNYADGWPMTQWDSYISNNATGDPTYKNQILLHEKDPFRDYGDQTHPYAVYKILYDAVANGYIEDDFSTTAWETSKSMINNGEIGCMVLGSWAFPQMEAAGEHSEDIGYMPFPITVDGVQYATASADYSYGINVNATAEEQKAAMIFVKWMTEESGFAYNEDGLPVVAGSDETKLAFEGVTFLSDEPAVTGEEDLLNELNAESELNIDAGGNSKIQAIIEHASVGDKTFDEIMADWNAAWSAAQEEAGVEISE